MSTTLFIVLPVLLLLPLLAASNPALAGESTETRRISDFNTDAEARGWIAVNDNVMGGVSKGGLLITDAGTLLFSGETSLQNNGGFSSIRMRPRELELAGQEGLSMRVKGDGRRYKVTLETDRQTRRRGSSYWAEFATVKDEWVSVSVPFKAFEAHFRGFKLPGPALKAENIRSIGFMIYDKRAGAFRLEADDLAAWRQRDASKPAGGEAAARTLGTIPEVAGAAGSFKTLLTAVGAAGLADVLGSDGPYTVFAPTDDAFGKLPAGTVEALLEPAARDRLVAILENHVVAGRATARDAALAGKVKTLGGAELPISFRGGRLRVGEAGVVANDVKASNGVIHVIDTVLLPPKPERTTVMDARLELLVAAIERGVPLFNDDRVEACVSVYEVAVMAVLAWPQGELSDRTRKHLSTALRAAGDQDARRASWQLRRAMDAAAKELLAASKRLIRS